MRFATTLAALIAVALGPQSTFAACSSKPVNIFLTGDSTTAPDGGWGDGFISFIKSPAKTENHGKSGRTTASYVAGGFWKTVLDKVKASAAAGNEPFVTIQVRVSHHDLSPASFNLLS